MILSKNYLISENEKIEFIGLNLLLRKIAFEDLFDFEFDIVGHFILQFHTFIAFSIFFDKIKNLFNYYTKQKSKSFFKIVFPRGIILFLNHLVNCKLLHKTILYDDMLELKHFYEQLKAYYECSDPELRIKEITHEIGFQLKMSITNQVIGKYFKFTEEFKKARNPLVPDKVSKYFDINEWSELEIARQLSLVTQFFFMRIELKELLIANWTKLEKYLISPNVMKMIDRFNNLSLWICEEILSYDHKAIRAKTIVKFLKVAYVCKNLCNFNDCMNIVTALNMTQVKSLKKTWEIVMKNPENANLLKSLNSLCSYSENYHNLRNEISSAIGHPCIPYLGLYLKELAYIDEGPKYLNENNLIFVEKIRKIGEKLEEIREFQSKPYIFLPVARLAFLADPKPKDDETLFHLSSKLEPKFILQKEKESKKHPTNTDLSSSELNENFMDLLKELSQETLTNV